MPVHPERGCRARRRRCRSRRRRACPPPHGWRSEAIERSRIDEEPVTQAVSRLVYELILLGDTFAFLLREPELVADPHVQAAEARSTNAVAALVERGQARGELRADLPAPWIAEAAGMLVYAAWMSVESGSLQRADAHAAVVATLLEGIRVAPTRDPVPEGR